MLVQATLSSFILLSVQALSAHVQILPFWVPKEMQNESQEQMEC